MARQYIWCPPFLFTILIVYLKGFIEWSFEEDCRMDVSHLKIIVDWISQSFEKGYRVDQSLEEGHRMDQSVI